MRAILISLLLSGCYIVAPDHGSGGPGPGPIGDDDTTNPTTDGGMGGAGPIGRTFTLRRSPTSPSCANFAQENQQHTITVQASDVLIGASPASNVTVRAQAASEANFDSPNVVFNTFEGWTSELGSAQPEVQYQVWVSGNTITGDVFTIFEFEGGTCQYNWRIQ